MTLAGPFGSHGSSDPSSSRSEQRRTRHLSGKSLRWRSV